MDKRIVKNLSPKELETIKIFQAKVSQQFEVVDLKLFGSKARGDFHKHSDIDILLVLKKVSDSLEKKVYSLVNDIFLKTGVDLSVKIFSEKEYKKLNAIPTAFMQLVQQDGISLTS